MSNLRKNSTDDGYNYDDYYNVFGGNDNYAETAKWGIVGILGGVILGSGCYFCYQLYHHFLEQHDN